MIWSVNRHETHQEQHQAPFGYRIFKMYMSNSISRTIITVTKLFFFFFFPLVEPKEGLFFSGFVFLLHQEAVETGSCQCSPLPQVVLLIHIHSVLLPSSTLAAGTLWNTRQ